MTSRSYVSRTRTDAGSGRARCCSGLSITCRVQQFVWILNITYLSTNGCVKLAVWLTKPPCYKTSTSEYAYVNINCPLACADGYKELLNRCIHLAHLRLKFMTPLRHYYRVCGPFASYCCCCVHYHLILRVFVQMEFCFKTCNQRSTSGGGALPN